MDIPSFWRETAPPVSVSDGEVPSETDVLIIGAGLSGLSVARRLRQGGRDVAVLDRVGIGGGASARNGGIVAPGLVDGMSLGIARYGEDNAKTLLRMTWQSLDMIREVAERAPFPIELELAGRFTLARDEEELEGLHENGRLLAAAGERVRFAGRTDVPAPLQDAFIGGIILEGGFVHSGRLTMGLAALALQDGVRIYAPSAVEAIEPAGRGVRVRAAGRVIRARDVVVATNGFTARVLPTIPILPQRGQMMVTEPLPPVLRYAMSARRGFDYFHQRTDGRLVIGGYRDLDFAAEATDAMALNDEIQAALTRLATRIAGRAPRVEWRWSCIMGFTPDHLPIAGRVADGVHIAAGFSGHGVVMAPMVGRLLAERMLGMDAPALSLFDPARPRLGEPPL